ncbi:hypothetical protein T01_15497 [Trichinella spiralis]|uniref:Uncharacterized protein n=1 Tax=Trichinella spiralis TaxID=6334 RepID=A0A0V1ASR8_TRISP|nr:hypothetical protein T01_15497 [Trichinella spiralis]
MFQEFLFRLQNIVKLKGTLLDCWGVAHPSLEKHVLLLAKNSTKLTLKNPGIAVCELFSAKLFKEKLKQN